MSALEAILVVGEITQAEKDAGVMDWVSNASEAVGLKPVAQSPILNMVGLAPSGSERSTGLNRPAVRTYGIDGGADKLKKTGPASGVDFARPVMSAGVRAKLPGYNSVSLGPIKFKK